MHRFEQAKGLAVVRGAQAPQARAVDRVAADTAVARLLLALSRSRAVVHALEVAEFGGQRLVAAASGLSGCSAGRHEIRLSPEAMPGANMAEAVLALRRAQHDAYGVRVDMHEMPEGDRAVARALLKADAEAFLVHVAAELAAAGAPALAEHVAAVPEYGPASAGYRVGSRRGDGRVRSTMAFSAAASAAVAAVQGVPAPGSAALGVARRLAMSSPAGVPYPERAVLEAYAGLVRAAVASRAAAPADDAVNEAERPALRAA